MKKIIITSLTAVLAVGVIVTAANWTNIKRMHYVTSLFSGSEQYENFASIADMFPVRTLTASDQPVQFDNGKSIDLPTKFEFEGHPYNTELFLKGTDTGALLILQNGKVIFEKYSLSGGRHVNWLSMSVAKSFTSLALGIAIDEGHIKSIEEPITHYVPSLAGSAYDQVRIKDILQMSSGAGWNEDYGNPDSEIMKMGSIMALGGSLDEFITTLKREREPGTFNQYNSADTQVLGALLVSATGQSVTDYMQEKIWQPLGMESDGYWIVDDHGMEMTFAGLNVTARDYAKIGELYRNNGNWNGVQIVSSEWVNASVTPDAPHLIPGDNPLSDFPLGYGYQWWVMDGEENEYSAIGVYNQFIYVNPTKDLVIVKLSANSEYGTDNNSEAANKELATIEMFRAIGKNLNTPQKIASH